MEDDDVPPISPVRVGLLILVLGGLAFGAYRLYVANKAVAAVAEASKDYRKLFPARGQEKPEPEIPQNAPLSAVPQSGMMLKIDDDMRPPKPEPAAPAVAETKPAPAPAPAPAAAPAAPVKPAAKVFNQPRLNQGAYSRLGGGGIGISMSGGGGGGAAPAPAAGGKAPAGAPAAAAAGVPGMPDLSAIPGMPAETKK